MPDRSASSQFRFWNHMACGFLRANCALIIGWDPSNRFLCKLMCIPFLSFAIFAWVSGNPFNGTAFSILSVVVLAVGLKTSVHPVKLSEMAFVIIGIIMVAFGLVYPHFTDSPILKNLYVSPAGLIPCPTLLTVIGFALVFNGFGSTVFILTLITFGLFYGIFGVFKLAVYLDLFLVLGAISLLVKCIISFNIN